MRKKLLLLFIAALFFANEGFFAQTVTLGGQANTPTSVQFPIYRSSATSSYNWSYGWQVIPASVLSASGVSTGANITSIAWEKGSVATMAAGRDATMIIRMKNSSATAASLTADWTTVTTGMTQVYSNANTVPPATAGYWTLTLSAPFNYTGGALEIAVEWTINTGTGSVSTALFPWNFSDNTGTNLGTLSNTSNYCVLMGNSAAMSGTTVIGSNTPGITASTAGRMQNTQLTYTGGTPCSGTPTGGTTTSTLMSTCNGVSFTLDVTGSTSGVSGLTYQWQSSPTGATYTDINGATLGTLNTTQTAANFYRRKIICGVNSSFSTPVQVLFSAATYASLPFNEDFETTWIDGCGAAGSQSIPTNSWRNNPTIGNNSWRRNDEVVANSGWSSVFGNYTPSFSSGASSARFHSYNTSLTGSFDAFINCSVGNASKQLSFDYINTSGSDSVTIQISTDGGTTFSRLDSLGLRTVWSNKTVTFTSNSATTIIRFLAKGDNGSTDIGLDNMNIITLSNCTGTPTAGTISGPASSCVGINFTITASGYTTGVGGLTYRWQSSANGTTGWTNTTGTNPAGFTTNQIVNTFYRLVDTCTTNNFFGISNVIQVTTSASVYATIPFSDGFETDWINGCATKDLPGVSWRNTPITTDSSWRREDDAPTTNTANWTLPTSYLYSPAFSTGAHSARFHSGYVNNRARGILDLNLNCSAGGSGKQLTFDYINTSGTDSLTVLVSTNGGTSFTRLDSVGLRTVWSGKMVIFSSNSATTVLRFLATADFGSTDIGLDNINIILAPSCNIPTGVAVSNITTSTATVSWTAPAVGTTPIGYECLYSTTNSTASGTTLTSTTPTVNITSGLSSATTYYVFVRSNCGSGNFSAWTPSASFSTLCNTVALPVNQGFEGGTTLPTCWSSSFVSGTRAFSIGDATTAAGNATVNPPAYAGANRLLFPSYNGSGDQTRLISAPVVTTGIPLVNVDFYWYLSSNGGATLYLTEGVQVQWSTDGTTWTNAGSLIRRYGAVDGWVLQSVSLPAGAGNQSNLFIGFLFTSNAGYDSYMDNIAIKQNPLPVSLFSFIGTKQGTINNLTWTTANEQNNSGFELQRGADGINFSSLAFVSSKAVNGNSTSTINYEFKDVKPFAGNNYYRLKQLDKDGKATISQIILLKGKATELNITGVYPNPASNTLNLVVATPTNDIVTIVVSDMTGKVLSQKQMQLATGDNNVRFDVSKLAAGTYMIKAICETGCDSGAKKFVKQ